MMNGSVFRDMLRDAKLPERSVSICLRGDLAADHENAERDLATARRDTTDSLEGSGVGAYIDRIEKLQADMAEHTYPFRLRALPRAAFRELIAGHPPRRDEAGEPVREDVAIGVDNSTFFNALIRTCTIDPELSEDEWQNLLANLLTDRQFSDLADAAWYVNRGEVDVPFSLAASLARRATAGE